MYESTVDLRIYDGGISFKQLFLFSMSKPNPTFILFTNIPFRFGSPTSRQTRYVIYRSRLPTLVTDPTDKFSLSI